MSYLSLEIPPLLAGMPSVHFSDLAWLRLSTISFFLMVFLLSAGLIRWFWNWLAVDFEWLPRLSYRKAVAVTFLWGLLFVIVLTMISGARELMTPGAWVKNGSTYKLRDDRQAESPVTASSNGLPYGEQP